MISFPSVFYRLAIGSMLLLSMACKNTKTEPISSYSYLYLAHTRSYDPQLNQVMPEVAQLDLSDYDLTLLGGDLALKSSLDRSTLDALDTVFDLGNTRTHWTLGNHDYRDHPEWISEYTKRPLSYVYHHQGITFLVLDSQADQGNTSGEQLDLFNEVMDTLSVSSHLVLMHHKLIWLMDEGELQAQANSISNGGTGDCFYCLSPNNFYSDLYPKLKIAQEKGISVICTAGDIGVKVSEFTHTTEDGIVFLASGLKDGADSNKVLLFQHQARDAQLTWEWKNLSEL